MSRESERAYKTMIPQIFTEPDFFWSNYRLNMLLLKKMKTVNGAFDRQSPPSQLHSSPDLNVIQELCAATLELTVSGDRQAQPAWTCMHQLPLSIGCLRMDFRLLRDFSAVDASDSHPSNCLWLALGRHRPRPYALPRQHRQCPHRIRGLVVEHDCVPPRMRGMVELLPT